jgi:hypothetical protein
MSAMTFTSGAQFRGLILLIRSAIVTLSLVSEIILLLSDISPSLLILAFGDTRSLVPDGLAYSLVFIDLEDRVLN